MLIDSHCHLNLINLEDFQNNLDNIMQAAFANDVAHLLSVSVELEDFPRLCQIADLYPQKVSISLGLHPNNEVEKEPTANEIIALAGSHLACIAIGETGLDYYRSSDLTRGLQKQRFRNHIQAAISLKKPLIIHTRAAAPDTIALMREEKAEDIGGVMHCFTESWEIAEQALAMNFYISLSGIVSFKNATDLHELAKKIPINRLLIETDSPYLAPVPFRGKQNHPALVKHVALAISELRQISYEELAEKTSENFYRCFRKALPINF